MKLNEIAVKKICKTLKNALSIKSILLTGNCGISN